MLKKKNSFTQVESDLKEINASISRIKKLKKKKDKRQEFIDKTVKEEIKRYELKRKAARGRVSPRIVALQKEREKEDNFIKKLQGIKTDSMKNLSISNITRKVNRIGEELSTHDPLFETEKSKKIAEKKKNNLNNLLSSELKPNEIQLDTEKRKEMGKYFKNVTPKKFLLHEKLNDDKSQIKMMRFMGEILKENSILKNKIDNESNIKARINWRNFKSDILNYENKQEKLKFLRKLTLDDKYIKSIQKSFRIEEIKDINSKYKTFVDIISHFELLKKVIDYRKKKSHVAGIPIIITENVDQDQDSKRKSLKLNGKKGKTFYLRHDETKNHINFLYNLPRLDVLEKNSRNRRSKSAYSSRGRLTTKDHSLSPITPRSKKKKKLPKLNMANLGVFKKKRVKSARRIRKFTTNFDQQKKIDSPRLL